MNRNKLLCAAAFVGLTAASIYGVNKTISVMANAKSTLANPNGKKFKWKFGDIYYTRQGNENGNPILFIHDLTCGSSSEEWKYIISENTKNNLVYSIDLLGCGRSEKPNLTYTNYLYVQMITDFVKNVIGRRTDVVVTGSSASFVLMSCLNDNSLYNKIVLVNPSDEDLSYKKIDAAKKFSKIIMELPLIGTLAYNVLNTKKFYTSLLKNDYFYKQSAVKRNVISSYYDSAHFGKNTGKFLLASIISGYMGINVSDAVKRINNSIFIIKSEFEPNIEKTVAAYQELNPSIEIATVTNSKHLPQLENPSDFISQLKIFL